LSSTWRRSPGSLFAATLEVLVGVESAPPHLVVVLTVLIVGGLFVGHLAADSYACWKGVRAACRPAPGGSYEFFISS